MAMKLMDDGWMADKVYLDGEDVTTRCAGVDIEGGEVELYVVDAQTGKFMLTEDQTEVVRAPSYGKVEVENLRYFR